MTNNTTADTAASGAGEGVSATTQALIDLITQRDAAGRAKYGTTLDRADLSPADWLQHMAEELLDGAGYALAAKREADTLRAQLEAAEAGNHRRDESQPTWAELTQHWKARAEAAEAEAVRMRPALALCLKELRAMRVACGAGVMTDVAIFSAEAALAARTKAATP